jgi:hypothetical protein
MKLSVNSASRESETMKSCLKQGGRGLRLNGHIDKRGHAIGALLISHS